MKIVAIVQARMESTRLPGKVLADIGGDTTLSRVITRLSRARRIDKIVIATTCYPADDAVVAESKRLQVDCFRGSEPDVLSRYGQAAVVSEADVIVRITSDCPLIDPGIVDEVVQTCLIKQADLACNDLTPSFPRGLDTEVFTAAALQRAEEIADRPHQREHVTPVFYERRDLFRIVSVRAERDYSRHRWTLDVPEDLKLIRAIFSHFQNSNDFAWRDVLALVEKSPQLAAINAHVIQKPVRDYAVLL